MVADIAKRVLLNTYDIGEQRDKGEVMDTKTQRPTIQPFKPYEPGTREWGTELIIAETDQYLGKVLTMKAGTMGGLQYHKEKTETFHLYSGTAWVEYETGSGSLTRRWMVPGDSIHVPPGAVHRVEAISDAIFFEVSTPIHDDRVHVEHEFGLEETGGLPSTG